MGMFKDLFGEKPKPKIPEPHVAPLIHAPPSAYDGLPKIEAEETTQESETHELKRAMLMSDESYEKVVVLLEEVAALKSKEGELKIEKQGHIDQIERSQTEVSRCDSELHEIKSNQTRLKRQLTDLRDEIFRDDDDQIEVDTAHVVTDGTVSSAHSDAKRAWGERVRELKKDGR